MNAFLIPSKGLLVRDPNTLEPLPGKGQIKVLAGPGGRYWRRRIKDGSVTIGKVPTPIPEAKKASK